jgi:hypothetical protein
MRSCASDGLIVKTAIRAMNRRKMVGIDDSGGKVALI